MKPWLSIFLLCACAAPQPHEGGEAVPASEVRTVAVVAPLSDAAMKARLKRTALWFAEDFKDKQRGDSINVSLKIEWYDDMFGKTFTDWAPFHANNLGLFRDMYHGIKEEYLQEYLNEFCYKFNRRYFGDRVFDRLVIAAVSYRPTFEHRMYGSVSPKCG